MFEVGISELALIGVIALIVLGPERLPKAARMAGALLRRLRGSWSSLRIELEREVAADELKRSLRDVSRSVQEVNPAHALRNAAQEVTDVIDELKNPYRHGELSAEENDRSRQALDQAAIDVVPPDPSDRVAGREGEPRKPDLA